MFCHLTKTKRLLLESYLKINLPKKKIADILNVHISTIYREIKRGAYQHLVSTTWEYETRYSSDLAHEKYLLNLKNKGAEIKLGKDYELAEFIEDRIINKKWSPLAIVGEIKNKGLVFSTSISVNTIYKYIEKGYIGNVTIKDLPMKSRQIKHKRHVVIKRPPKGTSIEQRPKEILARTSFGHWEMDCVCGPTLSTLLVLTERLTRKEIIMPMKNQKSNSVIHCLNVIENKFGKNFKKIFKSITVDNGSEFADSLALEKSMFGRNCKRTKLYYCHPYCSCERGTNERINREIRRLIPKSSDLSKYSVEDIQKVEDWVNDYPRQVLGFECSRVLFDKYYKLAVA